MSLTVDVISLKSSRGERFDLTNPSDREHILNNGLELDIPVNDRISGHPLVLYFQDFGTLFSMYKDTWDDTAKPSLVFNFFIPTSGWNEIDRFGRFSANWRLREQQVDFLLSYFEHWEQLKEYNLVIGFCDESPVLDEIVEQIYDCMNLYNIPKDSVMIMGHNFLGQNTINALCQERKELPIKYVVRWHMTGHMDYKKIERHATHFKQGGTFEYIDNNNWQYRRKYPISFLNRRPTMARTALLWGLYANGIYAKDMPTISAFPPLKFFKQGNTSTDWADQVVHIEYMGHVLQRFQTNLLDTLNPTSMDEFKDKMRVGKTIPGDYEFIGDIESQNVPFENNFYVWLTCETAGDLDQPNLFITEKVLKPFNNGQGLILFSQPGFLQKVKQLGYHTLGEEFGINEDYDDVEDNEERMKRVLAETVKICNLDPEELYERWLSTKSKVIENQKRIYLSLTNIKFNYTENLVKHFTNEIQKPYNRHELLEYDVDNELKIYKNFTNFDVFINN